MFTHHEDFNVEPICYDEKHINNVLKAIRENFDAYFDRYIETQAGALISGAELKELQKKFGMKVTDKRKARDLPASFRTIISDSIEDFEKDRDDYIQIMDLELLEEYEDDPHTFKSKVLKCECPIIRKTYQNKLAKELDKYRADFNRADAEELRSVVYNLCEFGDEYQEEYDPDEYENIGNYEDLNLSDLDTEDYTAFGVIGGGIKTHLLFKAHPAVFPNRSADALWALWYLTDKDDFGCSTDSEFLMIDVRKSFTQQNYFYPYDLFAYYAYELYKMLREKAEQMNIEFDDDYRYVYVDSFLTYIAREHDSDIAFIKSSSDDVYRSYGHD